VTIPADAQRWEAHDAGQVVGRAALWCRWGKYRLDIAVDDGHRRRGHGGRLLEDALAAARAMAVRGVQVRPNAADERSIAFAAKRDFVETMRMHHLEVDLRTAKHAALREGMDKLASSAVAIVTYGDFCARSKDPLGAYLDVFEAVREGWPEADPDLPGDLPTVVDWSEIISERDDPHLIVAEQKGRLVGFTGALGTGVRPELRGKGIATALKVCAIDAAIARGETTMTTASAHPAMRHLDAKLGFLEVWCELRMVRRLDR